MYIRDEFLQSNVQFYARRLDDSLDRLEAPGEVRIVRAGFTDYLMNAWRPGPHIPVGCCVKRGDDCFTARHRGRIVALGSICYADVPELVLSADEASLISFYTAPEYRGRGLYVALMQAMMRFLYESGYTYCYIWAKHHNRASLRGIERAGFQLLEPKELYARSSAAGRFPVSHSQTRGLS